MPPSRLYQAWSRYVAARRELALAAAGVRTALDGDPFGVLEGLELEPPARDIRIAVDRVQSALLHSRRPAP